MAVQVTAQIDSTTAQGGIYDRPFIGTVASTAVGGYLEGNTNYFVEDGVTEGFSMELRRFNIFLFSQVSPRIRFLSELEFERGTEEISIETAIVDFSVNTALVLRAGIILSPIGFLNQNHDSPRWDFVDRQLVTNWGFQTGRRTSRAGPRSQIKAWGRGIAGLLRGGETQPTDC